MQDFERELSEAVKRNREKIEQSRIFVSMLSANYHKEPLPVLQLGLAILLDKPIMVVAPNGTPIPETLRKVAHSIDFFDRDAPGAMEQLGATLNKRIQEMQ